MGSINSVADDFEADMCRCDPRDISKKKTTSVEMNSVRAAIAPLRTSVQSTCPIQHAKSTTSAESLGGGHRHTHPSHSHPHCGIAPYSQSMSTGSPDSRQGVAPKRANDCQIGCEGEQTGWGGGTRAGEEGRIARKVFSIEWYSALNQSRGERPGSVRTDSSLEKMMLVSAQSGISVCMCFC
jgi:hypothetical protein